MDLSRLRGGSGPGIRLKGAQPAPVVASNAYAYYGTAINISGINISAGMTQLCSIDVPAGKEMIVLEAQIASGLTSTQQAAYWEFEKDGEVVLSTGNVLQSADRMMIVGKIGGETTDRLVSNLVVNSNMKIRAHKPAGTSVTVQVTYILTERS